MASASSTDFPVPMKDPEAAGPVLEATVVQSRYVVGSLPVHPCVKEIVHNCVCVHAEVGRIGQEFVSRVMVRLVEAICEEVNRL